MRMDRSEMVDVVTDAAFRIETAVKEALDALEAAGCDEARERALFGAGEARWAEMAEHAAHEMRLTVEDICEE